MKIHEYQAKALFKQAGIPVPEGGLAGNGAEAAQVAETLGAYPVVVKAQIHAGGRGKGGGVKPAHSKEEVMSLAGDIIGMNLVTHQTGPGGRLVQNVLVEQGLDIEKELYLGMVPDRATAKIVIMASEAGGMDIEKVAEETPEKIIKVSVDPLVGIHPYHCRARHRRDPRKVHRWRHRSDHRGRYPSLHVGFGVFDFRNAHRHHG